VSATEIWKDVPGYAGQYQVSNTGKVRNAKRGRELKPHTQGSGYKQTMLSVNGKRSHPLVHRLVAAAFIPNPENKPQINHKNGNKSDNRADNLEWCTMSENLQHRHKVLGQVGTRSTPVTCVETGKTYQSMKAAAQELGVSRQGILRCCYKQQKATRNKLHFKFLEE
jgi:hypothetical protein